VFERVTRCQKQHCGFTKNSTTSCPGTTEEQVRGIIDFLDIKDNVKPFSPEDLARKVREVLEQ
ncbi:MAG: hypothetical protein MIO92_09975, partial [Methanosarcinaceae archaeon]|nr:hypothetical protein [Methanosarcinaceae archaeon]